MSVKYDAKVEKLIGESEADPSESEITVTHFNSAVTEPFNFQIFQRKIGEIQLNNDN